MSLIKELEKIRTELGIKQSQMAQRIGVPNQNYNNWIYRNSIPKEYIDKVREIITLSNPEVREPQAEYTTKKDPLQTIMNAIDKAAPHLNSEDQMKALKYLAQKVK